MIGITPLSRLRAQVVLPRLTRPDAWLLGAVIGLMGLGIVMVFDVSYFHAQETFGDPYAFFRKHLVAVTLAALVIAVGSRIRPEVFERWANIALIVSILALLLVLIPGIGESRGGARRWICTTGFCWQPSEVAKLAVVLYLARWMSRRRDRIDDLRAGVLPPLVVVGAMAGLMLLQPDFGTAAILGMILLFMLFVAGARPLHLGTLCVAGAGLLALGVMQAEYRVRRFMAFLDPWEHSQDSAFQLVQSLIAFGSGGITGVGLGQSRQKMFFLPEAHTDFVFALVGEELGLIGALTVLLLFAIVAFRGFRIATRHPDRFASLLAFGVTLVIVLSAVVNVGVVLGLLPTKGLALPCLSYGGSALLGVALQVGVLAGLSRMTG